MYYGEFIQEVMEVKKKTDRLYIYGGGMRGKELSHILTRNGISVDGFLTTNAEKSLKVLGLPVLTADRVIVENAGIILGLNDMYTQEVTEYLKTMDVDFSKVVDGGKYISRDRSNSELRDYPTLEVTTVIGCRVNCQYCPQKLLLNKYYEVDKNRIRQLTVKDFKLFLEHTPDNCTVMFAGMAEPFLNPDCTQMLRLACDAGRNVSLYTTLEGTTEKDIDEILGLPLRFVALHVADEKHFAHITETDAYYKHVERLLNATKENGDPFVNDVSAQAEPPRRMTELLKGKYEVLTSLHDRAGNLGGG